MKERPILFSAEMVWAVLDGTKTQTRRVIKPQPPSGIFNDGSGRWYPTGVWGGHDWRCPYGVPGDGLWVRETHAIVPRTAYAMSDVQQVLCPDNEHDAAIFRAGWTLSNGGFRWRRSIHMPRWASRIDLINRNVRVEELQDISEDDAAAEGIQRHPGPYILDFARLWNSTNATPKPVRSDGRIIRYESYPWSEAERDPRTEIGGVPHVCVPNPWVWVVEFEHIG
jgi:hypothetical protein